MLREDRVYVVVFQSFKVDFVVSYLMGVINNTLALITKVIRCKLVHMFSIYKILLLILFFYGPVSVGYTQTLKAPQQVELSAIFEGTTQTTAQSSDSLVNPLVDFNNSDSLLYKINCFLPDTLNIESIYITLNCIDVNDISVYTYTYDDESNSNFIRVGNQLCLMVGTHSYYSIVSTEIYVEDSNGNVSETVTLVSNF